MKKISTFFLPIFFTVILLSCKKEIGGEPCEVCVEIPTDNVRSFQNLADYQQFPCFNPNNSNEFIFVRRLGKETQIEKYDIIQKKSTILLKGIKVAGSPPKWSKNGWIVFTTLPELQAYLIKDDGTDLHILNKNFGGLTDVSWKDESIITAQWSKNGSPYYYAEFYLDGMVKDTIKGIGANNGVCNSKGEYLFSRWSSDEDIFFRNKDTIFSILNPKFLKPTPKSLSSGSFAWHPNDDDIFFTKIAFGIYKTNKRGKKEIRIKLGCSSRLYNQISISDDGEKIIADRQDELKVTDSGIMLIETHIYIMDINGKNEQKVEL